MITGMKTIQNFLDGKTSRKSSGFNFRMNELQGAIGIAQLKKLNFIIKSQRKPTI